MSRRVLITGSRDWTDEAPIRELIESLPSDASLIVGDCPSGVDAFVIRCASDRRLQTMVFVALWSELGRIAGPERNQRMVDAGPTEAHAFPMPNSRGTWDCVRRCEAAGVPVTIHDGYSSSHSSSGDKGR